MTFDHQAQKTCLENHIKNAITKRDLQYNQVKRRTRYLLMKLLKDIYIKGSFYFPAPTILFSSPTVDGVKFKRVEFEEDTYGGANILMMSYLVGYGFKVSYRSYKSRKECISRTVFTLQLQDTTVWMDFTFNIQKYNNFWGNQLVESKVPEEITHILTWELSHLSTAFEELHKLGSISPLSENT